MEGAVPGPLPAAAGIQELHRQRGGRQDPPGYPQPFSGSPHTVQGSLPAVSQSAVLNGRMPKPSPAPQQISSLRAKALGKNLKSPFKQSSEGMGGICVH